MKTINVANACILNGSNQVLLLQRSEKLRNPGCWGMPGGLVDEGEDYFNAVLREVFEETGIQAEQLVNKTTLERVEDAGDELVHITTVVFELKTTDVDVAIDPYEHQAYCWAYKSEISSLDLLSGQKELIAKIFAK